VLPLSGGGISSAYVEAEGTFTNSSLCLQNGFLSTQPTMFFLMLQWAMWQSLFNDFFHSPISSPAMSKKGGLDGAPFFCMI
jgi:hypothetical protein